MADGPEGYVSGLIWESRHTIIPDSAMALKVEVIDQDQFVPMALTVRVLEGPETLIGRTIGLLPIEQHSCVGLGRLVGYVVVRRDPVELDQAPGVTFFEAFDYLPDPADRSKGFKRKNNWFVPGEPAPAMTKPWDQ